MSIASFVIGDKLLSVPENRGGTNHERFFFAHIDQQYSPIWPIVGRGTV